MMIYKGNNVLLVDNTIIKGENKSGIWNKSFEEVGSSLYFNYSAL